MIYFIFCCTLGNIVLFIFAVFICYLLHSCVYRLEMGRLLVLFTVMMIFAASAFWGKADVINTNTQVSHLHLSSLILLQPL